MPKINQEEYEVLKELDDKWKWIARDRDGLLYAFELRPFKDNYAWLWRGGSDFSRINKSGFQVIQWEDEEPYNISELIKEYEFGKILLAMAEEETVLEFKLESEETEVKDIKWLKEEVQKLPVKYYGFNILRHEDEYMVDKDEVLRLINQFVPKQEEVDQAYKDGYEKGKQHTFYKGYLEGLADKENEPETVADVVTTFWKSFERLKEVMSMEVEELEKWPTNEE